MPMTRAVPKEMVGIKERVRSWKTDLKFNQVLKIPLIKNHQNISPNNCKVPIDTPRYLESAARKDYGRILK